MSTSYNVTLLSICAFILSGTYLSESNQQVSYRNEVELNDSTSVAEILLSFGNEHYMNVYPDTTLAGVSAEAGEQIVKTGNTINAVGAVSNRVSNHFTCIACHNIVREDPNLTVSDPESRLNYTSERGVPFLPGTTFYGIVNRTSYYNGDYIKKYGNLVRKARTSLAESIQLCATECSQGRELKEWELNSILAYFWTLSYKIGDLDLSSREKSKIREAVKGNYSRSAVFKLIQSKYLTASPATFVDPPENRRKGRGLVGRPEIGEKIYKNSCLHCHQYQRFAFFELDSTKMSINFLDKHLFKYDKYSVYQVARYGTSPLPGKKAYMPNYTLERLSFQQMADLRAFILRDDI